MKTAALMIILQLASGGADAYYTNRNLHQLHGQERNPLVQPFVGTQTRTAVYFSATTGFSIALPALLKHRHHNKLANAYTVGAIAASTASATWSATHARP